MENKVSIGFAEVSITPDKSVYLTGQFYERISVGVETPVTVTAMAVKTDDEQMVMVSCDLLSISDNLVDGVRANLVGFSDIDPEKVIIAATHTHASVGYRNVPRYPSGGGLAVLQKYVGDRKYESIIGDRKPEMLFDEAAEFVIDRVTTAVKEAWENKHHSYYQFGFGRAAVGLCRRSVYDDGSAKMWGDTALANFKEMEGGTDTGIELCYVFGEDQKTLEGIVVDISCPSQIMGQRSVISSDYWGKVKILLRERFGEDLKVLCLCGAAGDLCPRDLIRWVNPETPIDDPNVKRPNYIERRADPSMYDIKGTWKVGKRIVNEIFDTYDELSENWQLKDTAEFEHRVLSVKLPYRRVTIAEYENALRELKWFINDLNCDVISYEDNAKMHIYAGTIARYELQQKHNILPTEVHTVRFADVSFATNPFELFLNYGDQIRARSICKQTFLVQQCCGTYGYLPTEKAEQGSHYSAYVSSGTVGHAGGDILVRETVENINDMFKK